MMKWDGKSRVANDKYRKRFDEIFNQARKFVYKQHRKAKERLTGPLDSFSEDLQNSIKERKEKNGTTKKAD